MMGQCYLIHAHSGASVGIISWFAVDSAIAGSKGFQVKLAKINDRKKRLKHMEPCYIFCEKIKQF